MPRPIKDSVIVITGASSGIGRTTALEFAKRGATLLLAARREFALQEVATQCNRLGGQALAVPTNVTDEEAVQALARRAVETFGRLDVWVNNAAVTLFARFEEAPSEVFRQVLETNVFGYVHGARAALPYFREQGSGILINVDSVVGTAPQPYTSAYVMSKFAIRGLAGCLRMELNLDKAPDIHVCTVMPATIDTPLFNQAANYTGRATKALNPVYSAQNTLTPELYEQTMAQQVDQDHLQDKPAPATNGNLFEPMPEYTSISGGWQHTGEPITQVVDMAKQTAQKLGLPVS